MKKTRFSAFIDFFSLNPPKWQKVILKNEEGFNNLRKDLYLYTESEKKQAY